MMIAQADFSLRASYDLRLVLLSLSIAAIASYTALNLGGRMAVADRASKGWWLLCGTVVLGLGMWAMHFIAMLAYDPLPVASLLPLDEVNQSWLGITLGLGTLAILGLVLLAALFDRRMQLQKTQAEVVRQNEERFRSLVQNASDIITVVQPEGTLDYTSASIERILGYAVDAVPGPGLFDWVHPEDRAIATQLLEQALLQPNTDLHAEFRLCHRDGSWRNFEVIAKNLLAEPSIHGIVVTHHDITTRKHAEAALRDSEARFRQLAENIRQVFWMTNLDQTELIYVSPAYETIWGRSCEELYRHPSSYLAAIHPQDQVRVQRVIATQAPNGYDEEYRICLPDGSVRWIRDRAFPVKNDQGEIYRIAGLAEDITDRRQKEERLRLLESVVVHANDAIVITEAEPYRRPGPRIVYVNEAFTRMTGYSATEAVGQTPRILQGPHTNRTTLDYMRSRLQAWQPMMVELTNYRKDGSEFWVELSIVPVANQDGWYTHWISVQRDITERKQAEVEMRRALEREKELRTLKSHFISMASHEFRTPLATILASSDLLKNFSHKLSEPKKQERLNKIQTEVHTLTRLLDNLLLINRTEASREVFQPTPLPVDLIAQEILAEMQLIASKTHQLIYTNGGPSPEVCLDEILLRQIITNLLSNAVKYSPKGGRVWLDLQCTETAVVLQVQDEGIGIPASDQARLFEAFHRASNVDKIQGTGLGLAIVKQAVDLHGGEITVTSTVGVGTKFTVYLPTAPSKGCGLDEEDIGD